MNATLKFLAVVALVSLASADTMLQCPRGMRNRNREQNANNEANSNTRCYNTQTDNNSGVGRPIGEGVLYHGAILSLEWTSQHGCASGWGSCEYILQWLCASEAPPAEGNGNQGGFRDGSENNVRNIQNRVTSDVNDPDQVDDCNEALEVDDQNNAGNNCDTCRYESGVWWARASLRSRNLYLFTGNSPPTQDTAQFTRQNAGGTEYGTEIQEERDYFPWFHPDPFIDIVIFSENATRCEEGGLYLSSTMNTNDRHRCDGGNDASANTEATCNAANGDWVAEGNHNVDPPECLPSPHSRTNHNGNGGFTDFFLNHNFTITRPSVPNRCQIRLRYNMSSLDVAWDADYRDDESTIVVNNPDFPLGEGISLTLQMNPAQFSRTFEDRSTIWEIKELPSEAADCGATWMVLPKGRRGNIVETYPSPENDYHPQRLHLERDDCVAFSFSGTDAYNDDTAGGGDVDRDAYNVVGMNNVGENFPHAFADMVFPPAIAGGDTDLLAWRKNAALGCGEDLNTVQANLDGAPYLCQLPIIQFPEIAVYHYMNTRNNQWSNRSHKATIHVVTGFSSLTSATFAVGVVLLLAGGIALSSAMYAKNHPNSTVARIFQNGGSRGSGILSSRGGGSYGSYGQRSRGNSSGPSRGSRGSRGSRSRSHGSRKR